MGTKIDMNATQLSATQLSSSAGPVSELQIPMINAIVTCLKGEHRKFDEHILRLALAATRLASNPGDLTAKARAIDAWEEIRRELWSHLQIEDELVFSWGNVRRALSMTLLDNLKTQRQEMRRLLLAVPDLPADGGQGSDSDAGTLARTFIALAQNLDSHVERYDAEVLPSILRAVFHQ
jgi:iron-sulfur cluster repair protein YtfE (RIC family)